MNRRRGKRLRLWMHCAANMNANITTGASKTINDCIRAMLNIRLALEHADHFQDFRTSLFEEVFARLQFRVRGLE